MLSLCGVSETLRLNFVVSTWAARTPENCCTAGNNNYTTCQTSFPQGSSRDPIAQKEGFATVCWVYADAAVSPSSNVATLMSSPSASVSTA